MSASTHLWRYPFASELTTAGRLRSLRLATCRVDRKESFFFAGTLSQPQLTARLLQTLMTVVQSRFHIPAAMLRGMLAQSDPIVTANDQILRFEGFSSCCSAYTRIDLLPDAFEGHVRGRGTTNVDFNQPMLAALARIRRNDHVQLAVGTDQFVLQQSEQRTIEKQVRLPPRWMKGLLEVQAVQSRMEQRLHVTGVQALRFLQSLPRMKMNRRTVFVVQSGQTLRLTQVKSSGAVQVGGLERLRIMEPMVRDATAMDSFTDPVTGASGWVLHLPQSRFHLVLSPEVWRGFSGEGQGLNALATSDRRLPGKVRAKLKYEAVIDCDRLAESLAVSRDQIATAVSILASRGLAGFDLLAQSYFHRELPFDVSQVEKQQPRLIAARRLLAEQKVRIQTISERAAELRIETSGGEHRVTLTSQDDESIQSTCTCPWYSRHQMSRGPCKHILAAQIYLEHQ
ncbi:MAG: SWIM zinc finger family protein [Planctomycetaceae bacterium]|nr:SWIM zinc finger family protein [Planctomycetaceae bacterium]